MEKAQTSQPEQQDPIARIQSLYERAGTSLLSGNKEQYETSMEEMKRIARKVGINITDALDKNREQK